MFSSVHFLSEQLFTIYSISSSSSITMSLSDGSADASNTGDWTCKWDSDDQVNCIRLLDSNTDTGIDTGSTITVYGSVTEVLSYTYPNIPEGTIFEESDGTNHYMWKGTDTWNEVV